MTPAPSEADMRNGEAHGYLKASHNFQKNKNTKAVKPSLQKQLQNE